VTSVGQGRTGSAVRRGNLLLRDGNVGVRGGVSPVHHDRDVDLPAARRGRHPV